MFKRKFLNNARRSKMLVVCRAGTSNIDLDAAKRNNVISLTLPGRNAVGVAEMVVGMMISVSRNF